jgi:glycosyltransferase involved in cell wall biosynthesis
MEEASQQQSRTVGVVIPAFNEAENLPQVLNMVSSAEWVREIIVVDDGSNDATLEVAQCAADHDHRVLAIRLPENKGKAAAMLAGVQALHADLVIFLDADLVGLKPHHLQQLTSLQKSGSGEMAVAVFQIGMEFSNVPQRLVPQLSGQRCLWRLEAERALLPLATDRYAVETGLNIHAKHHHWHIRKIVWRGVTHHMVWLKQKPAAVLHNRLQMYRQIVHVIARNRYKNRREVQPFRLPVKFRFTSRR